MSIDELSWIVCRNNQSFVYWDMGPIEQGMIKKLSEMWTINIDSKWFVISLVTDLDIDLSELCVFNQ